MRKSTIAAIGVLISTHAVAGTVLSSGFSRNSSSLNALGQSFNNHSATAPKIDPNDMTMGFYAGEDVSRKLTISSPTIPL